MPQRTQRLSKSSKEDYRLFRLEIHQAVLTIEMDSEDCPVTESSSLHQEKGKKNNAASLHFETQHEGSLQVPIPCAVLIVVFITMLIIALIALSVGKYNCPGQNEFSLPSASHVSPCPDAWVLYHRKCYFFSTTTKSWTSAKNSCSENGATLAVIDSEKDMIFLKRHVGGAEHWIGLKNGTGQTWKWTNGEEFNHWFNLTGTESCAFLNSREVSSAECGQSLHWVCSRPSR